MHLGLLPSFIASERFRFHCLLVKEEDIEATKKAIFAPGRRSSSSAQLFDRPMPASLRVRLSRVSKLPNAMMPGLSLCQLSIHTLSVNDFEHVYW